MIRVAEQTKPLQLNKKQTNNGVGLTLNNVFVKCVIVACYLCQMLLLSNRSMFELYISPILAVCFVILTFSEYYYIPYALVMLTPNGLGTIFMGRISFYVFLIFLLVLRMVIVKGTIKFVLSDVVWLILGLANAFYLKITASGNVGWPKIVLTCVLTVWLIYINSDNRNNEGVIDRFLIAFAVAITTDAIVSLITRTATKYAASNRMGIIGFSSDDPNGAAMILSFAMAIFLSAQNIKILPKMVAIICLVFTVITTVSISGLIACVLVLLLYFIIVNKKQQKLSVFLFIVFSVVLAIYLFPMLGITGEENATGEAVNYLEYYQERLNDRFLSFVNNDVDSATSGRTEVTRWNMEWFSEQSTLRQLFGGNDVNPAGRGVAHNTFVDMILRFGYVGFSMIAIYAIYAMVRCIQRARESGNYNLLLCKFLMLYWSVTLSMFDGAGAVLWLAFVMIF